MPVQEIDEVSEPFCLDVKQEDEVITKKEKAKGNTREKETPKNKEDEAFELWEFSDVANAAARKNMSESELMESALMSYEWMNGLPKGSCDEKVVMNLGVPIKDQATFYAESGKDEEKLQEEILQEMKPQN